MKNAKENNSRVNTDRAEQAMTELKEVIRGKDENMMKLIMSSANLEMRLRKKDLLTKEEILKIEKEINQLITKYKN